MTSLCLMFQGSEENEASKPETNLIFPPTFSRHALKRHSGKDNPEKAKQGKCFGRSSCVCYIRHGAKKKAVMRTADVIPHRAAGADTNLVIWPWSLDNLRFIRTAISGLV